MHHTITVVHLADPDVAARFGALPNTTCVVSESTVVDGSSPTAELVDSWTYAFREGVYGSLSDMIDGVHVSVPADRWSGVDFLRVAGVGLLRFIREDLAIALAVAREAPRAVRFVTDNRTGLRLAQVVAEYARIFGVPLRLRYLRAGRMLALPVRTLKVADRSARRHRSTSPAWERRARMGIADEAERTATVAFFEASDRGWGYSNEVMRELAERGLRVIALAMPGASVGIGTSHPRISVRTVGVPSLPRSQLRTIHEAVHRTSLELPPGLPDDPRCDRLIRAVLSRRLAVYAPLMAAASRAATDVVTLANARTTFQFGHISPTGRAFMASAQAVGAEAFTAPEGLPDVVAPEHAYAIPADVVLAWGPSGSSAYERPRRIEVVGNHIVERAVQALIRDRCDRSPGEMILVAFGRPARITSPAFFHSAIALVATAAGLLRGLRVAANVHPGDQPSTWRHVLRGVDAGSSIDVVSGHIYELMARSLAVVTMHSTAGAEAICADIPVVCVGPHSDPRTGVKHTPQVLPEYVREGAAYVAHSSSELVELVEHIRTSPPGRDRLAPQRRAFAEGFLLRVGGYEGALSRIADSLEASVRRADAAEARR